jgi:hypothetical protein
MMTKQTFAEDMAALFGEFLEGEDEKGCVRDLEGVVRSSPVERACAVLR